MPAPAEPFAAEHVRRAPLSASTYDAEARTFEADLATATPIRRGGFLEVLEISAGAIDLGRVASGLAPLLDSHNAYALGAVLGKLNSTRIENGKLVGTIALADTDAGRAAEGMIARGEARGISVGYAVTEWRHDRGADGQLDTYTATRWELLEVSLVPVPADAATGVRSFPKESHAMTEQTPQPATGTPAPPMTRFAADEAVTFVQVARSFGDAAERYAQELVSGNAAGQYSAQAARDAFMRFAGEQQQARSASVRAGPSVATGGETSANPQFRREAMVGALHAMIARKEPAPESREFANLSIPQIAAELLVEQGERGVHRLSAQETVQRAWNGTRSVDPRGFQTTFTLPELLQDAGNRYLRERFEAVQSPIKQVAQRRSVPDFREITGVDLSGAGLLEKVLESGEIKSGYLSARAEKYRVETFAKRFALSRQAIVNDDLGAFSTMLAKLATAAAETQAKILADLVNSNPDLADGTAVFHADRGNLADTGAAPSAAALTVARKAMRGATDLDGNPVIVAPRYVLANPEYETDLEVLLATTYAPASVEDANPFAGRLIPLIDPRLEAGPWYVFSDPAIQSPLEIAYLNDQEAPFIEMQEAWTSLGSEYRAYFDFGAGFVDHRGAFKTPAAE